MTVEDDVLLDLLDGGPPGPHQQDCRVSKAMCDDARGAYSAWIIAGISCVLLKALY